MTKQEKKKIKEAIRHLHTDDNYSQGMDILAKLVGIPLVDLGKMEFVDISELPKGNMKFKAPGMKTNQTE